MPLRRTQRSITTLVQRHYENGQMTEKLVLQKQQEDIDDTLFQTKPLKKIKPIISIPESLQKSKKVIYKDKSSSLETNIQITKLSKTLAQDLTSKDKVSEKYWNSFSETISEKLSWHPQIDFQGLEQETSSVGSSQILEEYSQYSATRNMRVLTKNSPKTCWKLSQSSQQDTKGDAATQITRKIRIYPNIKQKKLFKKCFDAHRYFYNKAIEQIRENENIEDKAEKKRANEFNSVRNNVVINNTDLSEEDNNLWMEEIPYDTRQLAVKAVISARTAAFSNLKNGNITHFNMKFRNKKTSGNVFYVDKDALKNGKIFPRRLKTKKEKGKKQNDFSQLISKLKRKKGERIADIIDRSEGDFIIKQEKDNRYYVCLVVTPTDKILETKANICALDPGVRTFQTMYSEESVGEFGYNTSKKLYVLYRREDKLKSILAKKKIKSKKKYKLKKRCALLRTKIKHIVQDLHWRTAHYLTNNFQVILLPIFGSKNMANKNKRRISRTTTRLLLGLSHYDFQQKLIYKAKQRGRNVILCKEHYTTKCCGKCGTLNETIGSKKIFQCKSCDLVMDRDIHAARNILLRGLTIYCESSRV